MTFDPFHTYSAYGLHPGIPTPFQSPYGAINPLLGQQSWGQPGFGQLGFVPRQDVELCGGIHIALGLRQQAHVGHAHGGLGIGTRQVLDDHLLHIRLAQVV